MLNIQQNNDMRRSMTKYKYVYVIDVHMYLNWILSSTISNLYCKLFGFGASASHTQIIRYIYGFTL